MRFRFLLKQWEGERFENGVGSYRLRVIRNGESGELTWERNEQVPISEKSVRFMLIDGDRRSAKQNRLRGVVVGLAMFTT